MELVPVIDLLGGRVVQAVRGERSRYRPLRSPLCASPDAVEVAHAYLELYPFDRLYLADLDAIQGHGDNAAVIRILRAALPRLELWLDAGIRTPAALRRVEGLGCRAVIGSEALQSADDYHTLREAAGSELLLSLDFGTGGFLGPAELLLQPQSWPSRIICMTLARIGGMAGPDFARLARLRALAGERWLHAAGGIRDAADLARLDAAGVHGALVASALHAGRLSAWQIAALQT